ncbi:bifunctional nuclease family protein [Corynebacterium sp. 335C]
MPDFTAADGTRFVEVAVHGVRHQAPGGEPVLILHWVDGARVLPVWIDPGDQWKLMPAETAPRRPTAREALADMIELCGGEILRADVTGCHEGVFIARLVVGGVVGSQFGDESDEVHLDVRASDAVAMALDAEAPVCASRDVLDSASIAAGPVVESDEDREAAARDSVDEFRRFLDSIDAADFGDGSGGDSGDADGPGGFPGTPRE